MAQSIPKIGSRVRILQGPLSHEGMLMPNTTAEMIVLKLDSGYNIGILPSKITDIIVEDQPHANNHQPIAHGSAAHPSSAHQSSDAKPIISILHTGGTIASKVDYDTGGVIARYSPQELIDMFPELESFATIRSRLVRNMWSEDMRFAHYNIIAEEIAQEIKAGSQAIIITHGTDTLHYTAAALAFMLEHLPVPVILVGSQRSSDRASSDSAINLLSAVYFASTHLEFKQVAICMHENSGDEWCSLLPGTKSRKMHSSRRDAFKAINTQPLARINLSAKKIECTSSYHTTYPDATTSADDANSPLPAHGLFSVRPFNETIKVGLFKVHPNMYAHEISCFKGYAGLIIEGVGIAGNLPINEIDKETTENTRIAHAVLTLISEGTLVAATTQTIHGSINMNVYSTGRKMQDMGILGNYTDMTPETAYIKLAWLLSNYSPAQARQLYTVNLRGEISGRIEQQVF
jgi:glutamyl-tRNA(Gln) amidotransferase subunit D